ncbi:MAG: translocation/assembly module TamB domain-containing protein, partial [Chthoniobacterales bacterium]
QDDLLTVDTVDITRASNTVTAHGTYHLPIDFARARFQPADLAISINAAQLADYWIGNAITKISGPLQVDGEIQIRDGIANGSLAVYGTNLRAQNLTIRELSSHIAIYRNMIYVNDLTATLSGQDFVRASGQFGLDKPYHYKGSVAANISDLAQFKPLLVAIGNKNELAGSLVVDWNGSGQAANFNHSGEMKLAREKGRYANLQGLQAKVEATYAPDGLSVPIIYFGSDKMNFQAVGESNGTTLEISKIEIDQGKSKYATGYASVPFIWKNVGSDKSVFDPKGKVAITFQSENLDLKKLFEDIGTKPFGSGLVSAKLDAGGTLSDMTARLDVQMRELRSPQVPNFDPATFDLTAEMKNNQLTANGKVQQSKIQPIAITASLPLNVGRILDEKKFDENTPITAKVEMPRSSVNFVRQFVPALERVDGDLALNVNVNGTIAKPTLSGSADTKINVARFSNATLPALTNFTARLAFTNDTLNLENFRGDLAGGPFTVTGRITFPKLTQPNLDLQLKADAVLVARNDDLTARADANLRVAGPLTSATVSGNVAITNSQFLKNIDLIPIGLPGRPAPGPKPPADTRDFSFPNPPLRDWKFDVAVKTKDPFMIRGNLANGGAIVDVKLTGTGFQPKIEGSVRLQNVEATLPFSRLEIHQGFIYFNPADPFNPGIDLQGTSLVRDYTVRVYVYGTANEPQAIFNSEPPLPQEEIISLLATGTTREELLSGGNVLAGRAIMLLGQELYRKVFKKGQATQPNSVFDKLQVDVGNVDPRTGQQTATARFRVNEKIQLIGDIGVQGDFRGTVKYLIRFR